MRKLERDSRGLVWLLKLGYPRAVGVWERLLFCTAIYACFSLNACTHAAPFNPRVKDAGGQLTAEARISTLSPLIVEWPAAERGRLESQLLKGPVAVRYEGATIDLVPACRPTGTYAFVPMEPKSEHLVFGSALDLDASFPLGAARLGARLEAGKQLELTTRLVGRFELESSGVTRELDSKCQGATHMIAAVTVGAFRLYSSATLSSGAAARIAHGVGAGGDSEQKRSIVNADGSPDKCAEGSAQGPPRGCGALIRLELSSLRAPQQELLQELGTLDFTPIEKRLSGEALEERFTPIPFPYKLCSDVAASSFLTVKRQVTTYCERALAEEGEAHSRFPAAADVESLRAVLEKKKDPRVELLLLDAQIRAENGASDAALARLEALADEHQMQSEFGYFARYLLAGCGAPEVEERNLRELLHDPRLGAEAWPRLRLADHMLGRDRAHAVALAQSARSLASMCSTERLTILEWLGNEGTDVLSSGELFDIQLDAVLTLSSQGKLPSLSPLGQRALNTHDFQTWDASKAELGKDQWALGALYWAEGAECLFRGNKKCAAIEWRELLEKAPHSPYVVPAYHALLRVMGDSDPASLAGLSKLRPRLEPGSVQRAAIAAGPTCGTLDERKLQEVLDEAQELAVLKAHELTGHDVNWEVDSLSALAPELSFCAKAHPSNGKQRLLTLRINPENKKSSVKVNSADQSVESSNLAACVEERAERNASLFSKPFSVTIRVAPRPKTSFDHGQGWARHVRERFSCTAGDDAACIRLGEAWLKGDEVPEEPGQALAIFAAKCGEGNQIACTEEALLRRTRKSTKRSRALLSQACDAGQGRACRFLFDLEDKQGPAARSRMHDFLTRACNAPTGDPTGCVALWYAHNEGDLPPLDPEAAQKLLTTACRTLGHGAVEGPCSTPAELMALYPHRAGGDLGRLTCTRGIWQGCESAFIDGPKAERPRFAREGCTAGSPDACSWLVEEDKSLSNSSAAEFLRRAIKLCSTHEDTGHESVCEDLEPVRAKLKVLEWRGPKHRR